jgi:hypothetical protein
LSSVSATPHCLSKTRILKTMSQKIHKQIENKLEKLQELLNKITEAQVINPDEPET